MKHKKRIEKEPFNFRAIKKSLIKGWNEEDFFCEINQFLEKGEGLIFESQPMQSHAQIIIQFYQENNEFVKNMIRSAVALCLEQFDFSTYSFMHLNSLLYLFQELKATSIRHNENAQDTRELLYSWLDQLYFNAFTPEENDKIKAEIITVLYKTPPSTKLKKYLFRYISNPHCTNTCLLASIRLDGSLKLFNSLISEAIKTYKSNTSSMSISSAIRAMIRNISDDKNNLENKWRNFIKNVLDQYDIIYYLFLNNDIIISIPNTKYLVMAYTDIPVSICDISYPSDPIFFIITVENNTIANEIYKTHAKISLERSQDKTILKKAREAISTSNPITDITNCSHYLSRNIEPVETII